MKLLFTIFSICLGTMISFAQNKIVISYDDNGNRIKRELVCPGCRPINEDPPILTAANATLSDTVEELAKGEFSVYPNPANNSVNISLDALSLKQQCEIVMLDQLGKEHFRKKVTSPVTTIKLDLLADGMYYVLIYRDKQKDVVKIVKKSDEGSR